MGKRRHWDRTWLFFVAAGLVLLTGLIATGRVTIDIPYLEVVLALWLFVPVAILLALIVTFLGRRSS